MEDTVVAEELAIIKKTVRDHTLVTAFMVGADTRRYGGFIRDLKNASLVNRHEWPQDLATAYSRLIKWEREKVSPNDAGYHGLSFTNEGSYANNDQDNQDRPPRNRGAWKLDMTCKKCLKVGHLAYDCKSKKADTNVQRTQPQWMERLPMFTKWQRRI